MKMRMLKRGRICVRDVCVIDVAQGLGNVLLNTIFIFLIWEIVLWDSDKRN